MRQPGYVAGVAMVAAAGALWSLISIVIKSLEAMDVWQVLLWRSVGMIPVLAAFVFWRGGRLLGGIGWPGFIGGLGLIGAFAGGIGALQALPVANAVFLFSTAPFLTALLGRIVLGEHVRTLTWIAIAIAGVGIWVMIGGTGIAQGTAIGHIAALGSALGFSVFTVALRAGRGTEMLPTVILGALFSIVLAVAVLVPQGIPLSASIPDMTRAIGMGAILLALGMTLYTLGSRVVPASELVLLSQVETMLAPLWAWVILAEQPPAATLQGGALILFAVLLNALTGVRASAPQQT